MLWKRLYRLVDDDPLQAVAEARTLRASSHLAEEDVQALRASILVDAGSDLHDEAAIAEGADTFRSLTERSPARLDLQYNLANALSSSAQLHATRGWQWYQVTAGTRREARRVYRSVAHSTNGRLSSRAYANLGNLYLQSFRLIEAHDAYLASVGQDSTNAVAWSGAAKALRMLASAGIGSTRHLNEIAEGYLVRARAVATSGREHGRRRVRAEIERMGSNHRVAPRLPNLRGADPYVRWVAENRLALSPTLVGLPPNIKRWDTLMITSVTESISAAEGVPPMFAMFNTMKADYLTARWLTYRALEEPLKETGNYADTLDYANYGVSSSMLTLSHRAAVDILDRIAVAASEYFGLPGPVRNIYFWKRWHVTDADGLALPIRWQEAVGNHVASGNVAILAMAEMAEDLARDGSLEGQRLLRHAGTHRFIVLHEMMTGGRDSTYLERSTVSSFKDLTVEALQIVRAALFYLIQSVTISERQKHSRFSGVTLPLDVLLHHWVRGEDA